MTRSVLEDQRTVWIIAVIIFLLFLIGNLPWQLDDYDQAKQAFTSFQMIKEGHWVYQQTPHERVATKPPLVGCVSAGLFGLTRSWELSWRLPSLLSAIALAILLFRAAESAYGPVAGLIAFGAFGLNLLSLRLATLVRTDMPLALVIFLIGLLFWKKIQAQAEWTRGDRIYIFVLLIAAMLIKGPIVYAFLLPGIALNAVADVLWSMRTPRTARRLQAWPGPPQDGFAAANWWPWIASLAVFLLWVLGGILFKPGFLQEVVMREFLGRFGETIHRPQPLYFYFPHLLHKFAPWSMLMIAIALVDLYLRKWRLQSVIREIPPETFWLLCWSLGGLVVMSLIPSKRVDRIFPVIPPLCLLLAAQIAARISCGHGSVRRSSNSSGSEQTVHRAVATENALTRTYQWSAVALVLAILFSGGYTISKVISGYRHHRDALVIFGRDVRREASVNHWRYAVVSAKDEGLLLYLQKTHFIEPDYAITEWNRGNLDALVASTEKAPALMSQLQSPTLSPLKSTERTKEQGTSYVLITR